MPTYTYECKKCGFAFDVFHGITASPRVQCTECGASCKRRLGTGAGVIFKGSGFYETDYKRGDGKSAGKPASASESKSESKSDAKVETKTEAKTETKSGKTDTAPAKSA